jgi:5-methylcytosine-specific restriction endonuclease McrA
MAFCPKEAAELVGLCHERCCICHRHDARHGVAVVHIVPLIQGGTDSIDNAIAVCTSCRAEIHQRDLPRGIAFTPEELRGHRDQWLEYCRR